MSGNPTYQDLAACRSCSEFRYRKEHHKERDRERDARDEKWRIHAHVGDRPCGEVTSNAGPPISEQPNIHHYVTEHARDERAGGPSEKPQKYACAKHNWDHP